MICPKCGGRLVLNRDYYLVCEKCGAVVANTFFNERDLDEMYVTRKNPKQPHYLGTIIDNYALDRFYKYHSYLHLSHHNSTYYRVIQTLYRVCGRLNINKIVQARAITLYFKSIRNLNSKRPNHFRIMAAALALALRENDIFIPLTEIRKAFLKEGHNFSRADYYRAIFIVKRFSRKKIKMEERYLKYISYLVKNIFENEVFKKKIEIKLGKTNGKLDIDRYRFLLLKKSYQLTRIINIKKLQGKNPLASALSLLYIADQILCKKIGLRNQILTQRFLSEISGMALSTIVIRLRIIKGQLMGNLNEEYIYGNC